MPTSSLFDVRRMTDAALGAALSNLAPHEHLCSIYETPEERLTVAVAFIRVGLERGEKCVYVVNEGGEPELRAAMAARGIEVERAVASGQLQLETPASTYLAPGAFDTEWMFTFWAHACAEAKRQGFPALRAAGETEWLFRSIPATDRWIDYEHRLNDLLAHLNCFVLCQYKRQQFSPEVIRDIIRSHPTVVYRGVVARNMYYVPPGELAAPDQAEREVERLLATIWERERVENTLRTSEERWRMVFENSAIGIVVADERGNFVETNRAFQDLVGYSGAELKTMHYTQITHSADIPRGAELVHQLASGAVREVQIEKRYRHKDGRYIWVRATGTTVPGNERSPHFLLGLVEDVTDRKSAQQELDESIKQLRTLAGRLMHVQDDERRRIARVLHETAAQDLAALKMHLGRLHRTAVHLSDADRSTLSESLALADQSITEIRTMSYLLHPPLLDERGLLSALRWYASGFGERSGIAVDLELPETFERLPLDTETALFRIVQESLINIHRHASSDTARIRLQRGAENLVLEIEDRGQGMSEASLRQIKKDGGGAGVGIAAMSERIEQLGGRFEIESTSRGTIVRARLPIGRVAG
jgi:two-component system NarL family sensor kinase